MLTEIHQLCLSSSSYFTAAVIITFLLSYNIYCRDCCVHPTAFCSFIVRVTNRLYFLQMFQCLSWLCVSFHRPHMKSVLQMLKGFVLIDYGLQEQLKDCSHLGNALFITLAFGRRLGALKLKKQTRELLFPQSWSSLSAPYRTRLKTQSWTISSKHLNPLFLPFPFSLSVILFNLKYLQKIFYFFYFLVCHLT